MYESVGNSGKETMFYFSAVSHSKCVCGCGYTKLKFRSMQAVSEFMDLWHLQTEWFNLAKEGVFFNTL